MVCCIKLENRELQTMYQYSGSRVTLECYSCQLVCHLCHGCVHTRQSAQEFQGRISNQNKPTELHLMHITIACD